MRIAATLALAPTVHEEAGCDAKSLAAQGVLAPRSSTHCLSAPASLRATFALLATRFRHLARPLHALSELAVNDGAGDGIEVVVR